MCEVFKYNCHRSMGVAESVLDELNRANDFPFSPETEAEFGV